MSLAIHPDLETKIRSRVEAEGLTVEAYLERLVQADQQGAKELETLALASRRTSHSSFANLRLPENTRKSFACDTSKNGLP